MPKEKVMALQKSGNKVNLLIERDSGNLILILMGNREYALPAWKQLRGLCDEAIVFLGGKANRTPVEFTARTDAEEDDDSRME